MENYLIKNTSCQRQGTKMICIISGNYEEAKTWARGQMLSSNEWFYPHEVTDLYSRENFHVLVVGTAGANVPASYFNMLLSIAQQRGRINR